MHVNSLGSGLLSSVTGRLETLARRSGSHLGDVVELGARASAEISRRSFPASGGAGTPALDRIWQRFQQLAATCAWATLEEGGGLAVLCQAHQPADTSDRREIDAKGAALARDPAKGEALQPGGIEEASVAFMAEHYGVLPQPVGRETTGYSEFVDGQGRKWDVKSPLSPPAGAGWVLDVPHQVEKVHEELARGERVLLNLSRCTPTDAAAVLEGLDQALQGDARSRVAVLAHLEAYEKADVGICRTVKDTFPG